MTAEWVKVTDLLRNLTDSSDGYRLYHESEWFRMMAEKSSDGQFATLIHLIETEGFTDPIGVYVWDENNWEMGNGHHRLTAAILMGLDEILVDKSSMWPMDGRRENRVRLSVTREDTENSEWISEFIRKSEPKIHENDPEYV